MPVSLIAPDADNYQVGKGIVSFKPDGAADYIDLGNVAELEYTPNIEKLDHYSSRAGTRTKDKSVVQTRSGTLRNLMEELTARNLSMLLIGTVVSFFALHCESRPRKGTGSGGGLSQRGAGHAECGISNLHLGTAFGPH